VLTGRSTQMLRDYTHPKGDTIYVTGSDYADVEFKKFIGHKADFIGIACGEIPLWANQASTIALYDRKVKEIGINRN